MPNVPGTGFLKTITRTAGIAPFFAASLFITPLSTSAQSLDLTVNRVGVSFGDSEEVTGLRFNFRDTRLRRVTGINTTIWSPADGARSTVTGIAIGLPLTGARDIEGIGIGIAGVGVERDAVGIFGGLLGAGAGQDLSGLVVGGLGAGAGNDAIGIMVGGLGAGAGNDATGIMIGGLGVGAGNDATGIMIGGIGSGAGNDVIGLMISGIGAGAGRDVRGVSISGIGVGAGRELSGIHIAGIAAGAPKITGYVNALVVGGESVTGLIIAPAYFRVEENGVFNGLSISAFNRIKGEQAGVTIGILNWTEHLNGLQIGLLNFAGNKGALKWLPFFNYHRD